MLDHMVILFKKFGRTTVLFSTVAVPFYIPTSRAVQFFHILANICFLFIDSSRNSHPNGYEVVSRCSFDLRFPNPTRLFFTYHLASMPDYNIDIFLIPSSSCIVLLYVVVPYFIQEDMTAF